MDRLKIGKIKMGKKRTEELIEMRESYENFRKHFRFYLDTIEKIKEKIKTASAENLEWLLAYDNRQGIINLLEKKGIKKDKKKELFCYHKKLIEIIVKLKEKKVSLTIEELLKMQDKAYKIASSMHHSGYSMGEEIDVAIKGVTIRNYDNKFYYSGKFAGRETHGYQKINFKSKADFDRIKKIKGVWTIVRKDHSAEWLAETGIKQNWQIYWEKGWCYREYHSTVSLRDAKKGFLKRERAKRKAIPKKLMKKFLGIEDFRKIGACQAGINNFLNKININPEKIGGIRTDYLIELGERNNVFNLLKPYLERVAFNR